MRDDRGPRPFHVEVPEADLFDLRDRLSRWRAPGAATVSDWSQGVPVGYLGELLSYWSTEYDWRRCERTLNSLANFTSVIDDLEIHFIHVRSPHPGATPLILTHGWPGSILEFMKVIGPLSDPPAHGGSPGDAFDLVIPSLPGYGFSAQPTSTGWGVERIADAWHTLMGQLGYERYGAQGGDWGAGVSCALAERHGDQLVGLHLNMPVVSPKLWDLSDLSESESSALADMARFRDVESGYSAIQSTKPQTVAYGLTDSPAALAAWIVEKFYAWTDCTDSPETAVSRDEILDDVTLYWLTKSAASSARLYWESFGRGATGPISVPTGYSVFPREIVRLSARWMAARFSDLRYFHEVERGGHFAALEQPELFVHEVRSFFALVR